jgi:uncharacterized protein
MSVPAALPPTPRGSSQEALVASVADIYARLGSEQLAFLAGAAERGAPLSCPARCGSCCEGFVPDLLPAEAEFLAAWLLDKEPGLAREAAAWTPATRSSAPPCPFLRLEDPSAHCSIYPARPLVCRLFAAAGVRDKEGRTSFRPCSRMELAGYPSVGSERPSIVGAELERQFGAEPPVMTDHAARLVALCPSDATERALIVEALPAALAKLSLHLSLAEAAIDRAYSGRDEAGEEAFANLEGSERADRG